MAMSAAERARAYRERHANRVQARLAERRRAAARLKAALTGISLPDLPRAACRGHATLFDPQNDGEPDVHAHTRWVRAVEICDGCPELAPCATWVDQVPEKSRHGVIAGRFHK